MITLTCGVSLSGKTTWARKQDAMIVSRDSEREALFGEYRMGSRSEEKLITNILNEKMETIIANGHSVIIDNTHLRSKYIDEVLRKHDDIYIKVFETPRWEIIVSRNKERAEKTGKFIPEEVLKRQIKAFDDLDLSQYGNNWVSETVLRIRKKHVVLANFVDREPCYVVDVDGTIALRGNRSPYEWDKVGFDKPNIRAIEIVETLSKDAKIILCSGRDSVCRSETEEWLKRMEIPYSDLLMREKDDRRPDWEVKEEMWRKILRDNFIKAMVDDRKQVIDHARSLGFCVLDVTGNKF